MGPSGVDGAEVTAVKVAVALGVSIISKTTALGQPGRPELRVWCTKGGRHRPRPWGCPPQARSPTPPLPRSPPCSSPMLPLLSILDAWWLPVGFCRAAAGLSFFVESGFSTSGPHRWAPFVGCASSSSGEPSGDEEAGPDCYRRRSRKSSLHLSIRLSAGRERRIFNSLTRPSERSACNLADLLLETTKAKLRRRQWARLRAQLKEAPPKAEFSGDGSLLRRAQFPYWVFSMQPSSRSSCPLQTIP